MCRVLFAVYFLMSTFISTIDGEESKKFLFHSGRTVADVVVDKQFEILHCGLRAAEDTHFKNLIFKATESDVKIVKLKMIDMIDLVDRCNFHPSTQEFSGTPAQPPFERSPVDGMLPLAELLHASYIIVPRTKWCGVEDVAVDFTDMGEDIELDRCCRQHDFCPYDLKRLTKQNPSPYTQSACECDRIFYDCLKSVGSQSANDVGQVFFNIAKTKCVEFVKPRRCVLEGENGRCELEVEDDEAYPDLVIVEPKRSF